MSEEYIQERAEIEARPKPPLSLVAMGSGSVIEARKLLAAGADVNAVVAYREKMPLHYAAEAGNIDLMRLFLESGAELDNVDRTGSTPAFEAARSGKWDAVLFLLGAGADPNTRDSFYNSILSLAARSKREDVVRLALSRGAKPDACSAEFRCYTPLHLAVRFKGDIGCLRLMLDATPAPHAKDVGFLSELLGVASTYGALDAAAFLLGRGANVNTSRALPRFFYGTADHKGWLPLDIAMAKLLLDAGADVNAMHPDQGRPPLHLALLRQDSVSVNLLRVLLDHGADPNLRDSAGWTSVDCVPYLYYKRNSKEVLQLLLDRGAKLTTRSRGDILELFPDLNVTANDE